MKVTELNRDQLIDLKQKYLIDFSDETPSWGELYEADSIVEDKIIFEIYEGINFLPGDFNN